MKIIDLLNKIANGEEVPKKIKFMNIIYNWDIVGYLHYEDEHCREKAFLEGYRTDMCLNEEVEIIEDTPKEDKKIEKLDIVIQDERTGNAYILNEYGTKCYLTKHSKIIANKLNEIIDKINEGEENE